MCVFCTKWEYSLVFDFCKNIFRTSVKSFQAAVNLCCDRENFLSLTPAATRAAAGPQWVYASTQMCPRLPSGVVSVEVNVQDLQKKIRCWGSP